MHCLMAFLAVHDQPDNLKGRKMEVGPKDLSAPKALKILLKNVFLGYCFVTMIFVNNVFCLPAPGHVRIGL